MVCGSSASHHIGFFQDTKNSIKITLYFGPIENLKGKLTWIESGLSKQNSGKTYSSTQLVLSGDLFSYCGVSSAVVRSSKEVQSVPRLVSWVLLLNIRRSG